MATTTKVFSSLPTSDDPEDGRAHTIEPLSVEAFADEFVPGSGSGGADASLCCGCCCDFRKAVIAVDSVMIVLKLLDMLLIAAIGPAYLKMILDQAAAEATDDAVSKEIEEMESAGMIAVLESIVEILEVVAMALYACGIYGAYKFKAWGVVVAGSTYAVMLVLVTMIFDVGAIILMGFFLYPHVRLYKLLKTGVMTEDNYHNVSNCCGNRQM